MVETLKLTLSLSLFVLFFDHTSREIDYTFSGERAPGISVLESLFFINTNDHGDLGLTLYSHFGIEQ